MHALMHMYVSIVYICSCMYVDVCVCVHVLGSISLGRPDSALKGNNVCMHVCK